MKAGIITHYDVHNHGAHLQLYAMIQVLKELGYEAKALTYTKNYDFMEDGIENKYRISIKSIPIYLRYLKKKGLGCTLYNFKKKKLLDQFRQNENCVGEKYTKASVLDLVVIGSDEIFSIEPGLNPCFWGIGVPCKKIVSYAASFGPTTMEFIRSHNASAFIKAGISTISSISVRDENSREIVKELSGVDAAVVCDPVLLYGFEPERKIAAARKPKENYMIVYSYDDNMNDPDTVREIKAYAKQHDLKIYSVGFYHKWCDKSINVTPLAVFSWFQNASLVVTDTFHGSVLSILNETPFVSIVRGNANKLRFLLKQYALESRIATCPKQIESIAAREMDFPAVRSVTEENREKGLQYLKVSIEENCHD